MDMAIPPQYMATWEIRLTRGINNGSFEISRLASDQLQCMKACFPTVACRQRRIRTFVLAQFSDGRKA
jgi:hypothetical protein